RSTWVMPMAAPAVSSAVAPTTAARRAPIWTGEVPERSGASRPRSRDWLGIGRGAPGGSQLSAATARAGAGAGIARAGASAKVLPVNSYTGYTWALSLGGPQERGQGYCAPHQAACVGPPAPLFSRLYGLRREGQDRAGTLTPGLPAGRPGPPDPPPGGRPSAPPGCGCPHRACAGPRSH